MERRPFVVDVAQATLDDLRDRLARTRWPDEVQDAGWDYGANLAYMRELGEHWRTRLDWRAQERAMNALPHFRAEVEGIGIHVVHMRGRRPAPMPLLIIRLAELVRGDARADPAAGRPGGPQRQTPRTPST